MLSATTSTVPEMPKPIGISVNILPMPNGTPQASHIRNRRSFFHLCSHGSIVPYTQPRNADLLLQRFLTTHLRGIFLVFLLSNPISVVQCFHRAIRSVRNPPDNLHVRWLHVAELVVLCGACSYTGMCSESSLRQPCLRALFFQPVLEHHKAPPAKAFMDANVFAHAIYMKNHSCHDVCAGTKPCSCCYGTIQHLPRQQGIKKRSCQCLAVLLTEVTLNPESVCSPSCGS